MKRFVPRFDFTKLTLFKNNCTTLNHLQRSRQTNENVKENGVVTIPPKKFTCNKVNSKNVTTEWPQYLSPLLIISFRPMRFQYLKLKAGHWQKHLKHFAATDGSKLNIHDLHRKDVISARATKRLKRGQIGCYDSHVRCWQYILDTKLDMCVIAEDDCYFVPSAERVQLLEQTMHELKTKKIEWDMLYLEYRNVFGKPNRKQVTCHTFMPSGCQCLYMYILTFAGAQKLLQAAKPYDTPVDVYVSNMSDTDKIVSLCMTPALGRVSNIYSDTEMIL